MNFIKLTTKTKAIVLPFKNGCITLKGYEEFTVDVRDQLSEDLDQLLFSFFNTDLFLNCSKSEAVFESLKCVKICIDNILLVEDERFLNHKYWTELLSETNNLLKQLN